MNKHLDPAAIEPGLAGTARHGKWSQPRVPHKGWRCINSYDSCPNGEALHLTCQMCESQSIRYVHTLVHDDYPGELACGSVCAERMEEDYVNPRKREQKVKSASAQRRASIIRDAKADILRRWHFDGSDWRLAYKQNRITIFPYAGGYKARLHLNGEGPKFLPDVYPDPVLLKKKLAADLVDMEVRRSGLSAIG